MRMALLGVFSLALLFGCDSKPKSPAVVACEQVCQSNTALNQLASKVVFKPVKLCKDRCEKTDGTCSETGGPRNLQACVHFGMNAGREPGESGPLLKFN